MHKTNLASPSLDRLQIVSVGSLRDEPTRPDQRDASYEKLPTFMVLNVVEQFSDNCPKTKPKNYSILFLNYQNILKSNHD